MVHINVTYIYELMDGAHHMHETFCTCTYSTWYSNSYVDADSY